MSDVKLPSLNRSSRESDSRAKDARRKPWAPPSRLDAPLRLRDLSTDGFAPRLAGLKIARTFPASSVRATNLFAAMSILTTPCPRSRTVDMLV